MNRKNDKHFFECWDLASQIREAMPLARPKELQELKELEEQLFEESGFYTNFSYQDAIEAYKDHTENAY